MAITARVVLTGTLALSACLGWSRAATAQGDQSCSIDPAQVPGHPIKTDGIVVGSTSPEQARVSTAWMERQVGIKISPDYADLPRVVVRVTRGKTVSETLAAVVDGHPPHPGDHVEILSRYRDPRSRCNFIPWTVGATPALS